MRKIKPEQKAVCTHAKEEMESIGTTGIMYLCKKCDAIVNTKTGMQTVFGKNGEREKQ